MRDSLEAPSLAIDSQQRIYLAWASQTGDAERTLFLTTSSNDGQTFSSPRAVARSAIFSAVSRHRGKTIARPLRMLPHLTAGERVYLAWCASAENNTTVQMVLAQSDDGGQTFGTPRPVHRSLAARPTFTALAASPTGHLACSWLDNRNGVQQPFAAVRTPPDTEFGEETLIHAGQNEQGVCPCCPTATAIAADGTVLVAFRNHHDGYRDIAVAKKRIGESVFSEPTAVVPATWRFNGCPHDGPSLAVTSDDVVHIAWMDAHTGRPQVYYGRAMLNDLQFSVQPINELASASQGNAKLCLDRSGTLYVVWEESLAAAEVQDENRAAGHQHRSNGSGRSIMLSWLRPDGTFEPARAISPRPGTFQTRPSIACTAGGLLVIAWNELAETGKHVVVKAIRPHNATIAEVETP